ncbi:MAG TPA: hypothetical protein VKR21_00585 [Solirubrobacteraceae bacterium]|nr:hypothetical protein [Solirubrobacteraceae bacterium]
MPKLAVSLALLGLLLVPAAASGAQQTASAGNVTASFSFSGQFPHFSNERLTISQSGTVLYDQAAVSRFCGSRCAPGSTSAQASSVHLVNLEGTSQLDVVLDLFTGGAHCCSVEQVFSFDPGTMTYVKTERNFGDPGARLVPDPARGGRVEFLTADDSFAYEFTDFAASGLPVQILSFANRRFHNVTRSFPSRVAADARRWMRAFRDMARDHYRDSVGVIAAWAADEDLLGHSRHVDRFLNAQARAGHLNAATGQPGGKRFVANLHRFLRRHGYLR